MQQEKLCCTHKGTAPDNESWIRATESTLGNRIKPKNATETIYWLEHRTKNKSPKWFWEIICQANEQLNFFKDSRQCKKAQGRKGHLV